MFLLESFNNSCCCVVRYIRSFCRQDTSPILLCFLVWCCCIYCLKEHPTWWTKPSILRKGGEAQNKSQQPKETCETRELKNNENKHMKQQEQEGQQTQQQQLQQWCRQQEQHTYRQHRQVQMKSCVLLQNRSNKDGNYHNNNNNSKTTTARINHQ